MDNESLAIIKEIDLRKIHKGRAYSIREIVDIYGVQRKDVNGWIKSGLPLIDDKSPFKNFIIRSRLNGK